MNKTRTITVAVNFETMTADVEFMTIIPGRGVRFGRYKNITAASQTRVLSIARKYSPRHASGGFAIEVGYE